jgi:RHS repeat-associated protein
VGGQYTKAYTYTAARDDADRGGFLGFQQIDEVDSRGGFITKAYYDQAFPKTGMINKREVYQANGTLISRTTYTNSPQALDSTAFNQRYFQHVSDILEETFKVGTDPAKDGQPLTKVQTTYSNLDAATGNIGKVTVKLTDNDADSPDYLQSWTKATTYTFAPANSSNRCISLVQSVRAEYSKGTDPASLSRVIDFTPDTGNCRVSQQIVEPSSAKYRVETTYGYDAFGNVNSTSTIGRNPDGTNMPARTTAADWGATGQFLVNSWNELNQLTAHDYNYDLGTLKSSTNPNNLTSSLLYDTFGRLEKITRPDGTASKWEVGPCSPSCLNDFHKMTMTARELNADGNTATDTISYVDQAGRTLVSRSRLPNDSYQWIENRFDARGRLAMQGIPCASSTPTSSCVTKWVQFGYDDMGRITSTTRPIKQNTSETAATSVSYDGRTTTVLDPYGKRTRLTLNARGVARRSIDENDYYQDYIYDVAGSLKEVTATDTVGTKTLFSGGYEYGALPFQTSSFERSSGSRTQTYNSVGELVAWSDSKGQQFSAKYDALSRLTERTEPDNVTKWIWGGDPALKNVGELQTIRFEPAGGYSESYSYDSLGRMRQKDITIPGQGAFSYNMAYDANTGHIDTLTYPDNAGGPRLVVKYNHSQQGVLQSVVNPNESTTYWTLNSVNTRGQVTSETYGNGIVRDQVIDTVSGLLDSIHVGTAANPNAIQNMTFSYDLMGNVTQRQNGNAFLTEDFVYGSATDASYRLGSSILKSGSSPAITNLSLTYDGAGNMLSKTTSDTSDVMLPHAVVWSSANYPTQITTTTAGGSAVETATFAYGPRRDRWKMDFTSAGVSETTYYIGGLLEKVTSGVNVEYRHYIQASDETIAILTRTSSGSTTLRYMFSDRQGTVDSVLNAGSGARLSQSFSAFGEPRNAATWSGPPDQAEFAQMAAITRQGYTFQTVLGRMGMNHMNGRVQDAVTGRFLSPDPFVGNPSNTQNFNRYAYVSNNPLTFLDPTGFDQSGIASGIPQLPNHYPGEDRDPNWDIGVRDSDYFWYGAWWQVTAGNPTAACTNMLGGTMSAAVCGMPFGIGLGSAIAQSVAAQMKAPPYFGVYTDRSVSPPSYETKCETLSCYAAGWSIPDGVYNDLMGAFDAVSVGLATRISELVHGDQVVDRNSERYKSSLVTTSILYSAVTMGASAYTTSAAAGTIAVANAGAAATTTTQLTAQQIIQNVARAEHAKGLAHLRQYLRGNEEKLLAGAKTARMITGTLVHRATDAALRTLYPGRFKYSSNKGIDFEDTVSKTFIELTTKAQSLYKQLKYGIPPSQVATY